MHDEKYDEKYDEKLSFFSCIHALFIKRKPKLFRLNAGEFDKATL